MPALPNVINCSEHNWRLIQIVIAFEVNGRHLLEPIITKKYRCSRCGLTKVD